MKVTSYSEVAEKSMMFAVNAVPVPIVYDLAFKPASPLAAYAPRAVRPVIALKFATTADALKVEPSWKLIPCRSVTTHVF